MTQHEHKESMQNLNRVTAQGVNDTQSAQLLWDAYLVLDHGDAEERLAMLATLEAHFKKNGIPSQASTP